MSSNLSNRHNTNILYNNVQEAEQIINKLEQKHPIERKISFFLDIRGILKVNHLYGSYMEYGCFRCETMFFAEKILDETKCMKTYYGIDIFDSSKLLLTSEDEIHNRYDIENIFKVDTLNISNIFKDPSKINLIKGDLRNIDFLNTLKNQINVAVIDCNFLSSLKCSIDHALDNIINCGFIFIDDYFTNLENGQPIIHKYFMDALDKRNMYVIDYKTYAPFAKSFMILKN